MITSWFIFALLSLFALAGLEIAQKISLSNKANIHAVTNNFFVWTIQGLGGLMMILLFDESNFALNQVSWVHLLLVAFAYFAGGTLYYTSYKSNSPSVSIVLGSLSVVVSTVLGINFFNESTGLSKIIGIITILLSIIYLNINKKIQFDKYNLYALIGGLCFGIAYTIDKFFVIEVPVSIYFTIMCFSVAAISLLLKWKIIAADVKRMKTENYLGAGMSSFFGTLFNFFTFNSYRLGGNVGVVDAINNTAVFFVIIIEIIILNDKSNLFKKIVASLLVVSGVFLLSFV